MSHDGRLNLRRESHPSNTASLHRVKSPENISTRSGSSPSSSLSANEQPIRFSARCRQKLSMAASSHAESSSTRTLSIDTELSSPATLETPTSSLPLSVFDHQWPAAVLGVDKCAIPDVTAGTAHSPFAKQMGNGTGNAEESIARSAHQEDHASSSSPEGTPDLVLNGLMGVESLAPSLRHQASQNSLSSELSTLSSFSSASQNSASTTGSATIRKLQCYGTADAAEVRRLKEAAVALAKKWKESWCTLNKRLQANLRKQERKRTAKGDPAVTRKRKR